MRNISTVRKVGLVEEMGLLQRTVEPLPAAVFIIAASTFIALIPATFIAGTTITIDLILWAVILTALQIIFVAYKLFSKNKNVVLAYIGLGAVLTIPGGIPLSIKLYEEASHVFGIFIGGLWLLSMVSLLMRTKIMQAFLNKIISKK